MACQLFQWLIAGGSLSMLQYSLVGIGCLLAYDAWSRWNNRPRQLQISDAGAATAEQIRSGVDQQPRRRAA